MARNRDMPGVDITVPSKADKWLTRRRHKKVECPKCGFCWTVLKHTEYCFCKCGHEFFVGDVGIAVEDPNHK